MRRTHFHLTYNAAEAGDLAVPVHPVSTFFAIPSNLSIWGVILSPELEVIWSMSTWMDRPYADAWRHHLNHPKTENFKLLLVIQEKIWKSGYAWSPCWESHWTMVVSVKFQMIVMLWPNLGRPCVSTAMPALKKHRSIHKLLCTRSNSPSYRMFSCMIQR